MQKYTPLFRCLSILILLVSLLIISAPIFAEEDGCVVGNQDPRIEYYRTVVADGSLPDSYYENVCVKTGRVVGVDHALNTIDVEIDVDGIPTVFTDLVLEYDTGIGNETSGSTSSKFENSSRCFLWKKGAKYGPYRGNLVYTSMTETRDPTVVALFHPFPDNTLPQVIPFDINWSQGSYTNPAQTYRPILLLTGYVNSAPYVSLLNAETYAPLVVDSVTLSNVNYYQNKSFIEDLLEGSFNVSGREWGVEHVGYWQPQTMFMLGENLQDFYCKGECSYPTLAWDHTPTNAPEITSCTYTFTPYYKSQLNGLCKNNCVEQSFAGEGSMTSEVFRSVVDCQKVGNYNVPTIHTTLEQTFDITCATPDNYTGLGTGYIQPHSSMDVPYADLLGYYEVRAPASMSKIMQDMYLALDFWTDVDQSSSTTFARSGPEIHSYFRYDSTRGPTGSIPPLATHTETISYNGLTMNPSLRVDASTNNIDAKVVDLETTRNSGNFDTQDTYFENWRLFAEWTKGTMWYMNYNIPPGYDYTDYYGNIEYAVGLAMLKTNHNYEPIASDGLQAALQSFISSLPASFAKTHVSSFETINSVSARVVYLPYKSDLLPCPNDPNKTDPGICGCGSPDLISIIPDTDYLVPGQNTTVRAQTKNPADGDVTWSVIPIEGSSAKADLKPLTGPATTLYNVRGDGEIMIRATSGSCVKDIKIKIGCQACENGSCAAGSGSPDLSSIDLDISLGKTKSDRTAGQLQLKEKTITPETATPQMLEFNTFSNDLQVLRDGDSLRQIIAPDIFVDIVTIDQYGYAINFYRPSDLGSPNGDFYETVPGAEPVTSWTVENPDASDTIYNRLRLTEKRGSSQKVHEYHWDASTQTWSLSKGNSLQILSSKKETISGDLVVTDTIKDDQGQTVSKIKTTWHSYDWGDEIIAEVEDPDNFALTTIRDYYTNEADNGYGKIKSQVNPDGSWSTYSYNAEGLLTTKTSSWLDLASGSTTARTVEYSFTPLDAADSNLEIDSVRPRLVIETIDGKIVGKTFYLYSEDTATGERTEIVERATSQFAVYGDSTNLRTTTISYLEDFESAGSGRVKTVVYPDATMDEYSYEFGEYVAAVPIPGIFISGDKNVNFIKKTVTHGTASNPDGIANKTTREISISSRLGDNLLNETKVYTGSGYEQLNYATYVYDEKHKLTDTYYSNGTHSESSWSCCSKSSETDIQGIITNYPDYDDLGRVLTITHVGTASTPDITTSYTYDAIGRQLSQITSSSGLSLSNFSNYDTAGRLEYSKDSAGLTTNYIYDTNNRDYTITYPGGTDETNEYYLDGQLKSTTGSAVVNSYYTYGINTDGSQWTQVNYGTINSQRWERTTRDLVGRTIKVERPGYLGIEISEQFYNAIGQLIRSTTPGQADTLYGYDELGNQFRQGLDVNNSNVLEIDSMDRITESTNEFVKLNSIWWRNETSLVYPDSNDGTSVITSINRNRLTGLGQNGLISQSFNVDIHGIETLMETTIDRDNKILTKSINFPDSTNNQVIVNENGHTVSVQSKTGHTTTYNYDALGRQTGVVDPRTGESTTHYNLLGQVDYVENGAGNRTQYFYYPETGSKWYEIDPNTKTTYFQYDDQGQITHTWGSAAMPVLYQYDDYGKMTEMNTFRNGTGWDSNEWPEATTGTPDITKWNYHPASGLLESKEDAKGKAVEYIYADGGKVRTRTWAREHDNLPLSTTYGYDPDTGELTSIDYSDTTPDLSFTYDRLGRQDTITDGHTQRIFSYNSYLQQESESITGLYTRNITRTFDQQIPGRNNGFINGTTNVTYGFEPDTGKFQSVSWSVNNASQTTFYTYLPDSDLIETITSENSLIQFTYEPFRNLKERVANSYNSVNISTYDYHYDEKGRRDTSSTSGSAFEAPAIPVSPDVGLTSYTPNELNQYSEIDKNGDVSSLAYDDDGNQLGDNTFDYTWNAENRLISVTPKTPAIDGEEKLDFAYDYMGRRIFKTISSWDGADWQLDETTFFVYNGWNLIEELADNGQTKATYINGLDLSQSIHGAGGIGGILARIDHNTGNVHNYFFDGNGNVGQLIDRDYGTIDARYDYLPFGKSIVSEGAYANINPFRFSTKYFDEGIALYYYGYRYYSAKLGRWVSRDPIEEKGGLNLYAFVGNDVVNQLDLLGEFTLADARDNLRKRGEPLQNGLPIYTDTQVFDEWLILEESLGAWWRKLPKCPEKICLKSKNEAENPDKNVWSDPNLNSIGKYILSKYHPGAKFELRTLKGVVGSPHGNQCTYDSKGQLLKSQPASGSADLYGPLRSRSNFLNHQDHDVAPFELARKIFRIADYYKYRPQW